MEQELPSAAGRSGSVAAAVLVAFVAELLVAASDQPCAALQLAVGVPQRLVEPPGNGEPQQQRARPPSLAPASLASPRSLRRPWPFAPCATEQPAAKPFDCAELAAAHSEPVREGPPQPR